MHIKSFKYTKADRTVSNRTVLVLKDPGKFVEGYDIGELEPHEQAMFANEINTLHDEYIAKLNAICADYDMNYRYRQFKPESMSDIEIENL